MEEEDPLERLRRGLAQRAGRRAPRGSTAALAAQRAQLEKRLAEVEQRIMSGHRRIRQFTSWLQAGLPSSLRAEVKQQLTELRRETQGLEQVRGELLDQLAELTEQAAEPGASSDGGAPGGAAG